MTPELEKACGDLAAWAQEEGIALFVLHTTEGGNTRFIGPKLPAKLVASMLRASAEGYEAKVPGERLN